MNEIPEIERYLRKLPEFAMLTAEQLHTAAASVSVAYYRSRSTILDIGKRNDELNVVRSGAVELRNEDGDLVTRLAEGDCFGFPSLMNDAPIRNRTTAIEDTLVYHLKGETFSALRRDNSGFDTFFIRALSDRLLHSPAGSALKAGSGSRVGNLVSREPVSIDATASIRETARQMVEQRVSAMLVETDGDIAGIVTDRDIRSRVVAPGRNTDDAVAKVMSPDPITLDVEAHAYEAALVMMQNNIHHLPVTRDGAVAGMVSRSDFMRLETEHPLYLVSDLGKQDSAEGLADVCKRLPALVAGQIEADANGEQLGKFITTITDTVTRQLLKIAEAEIGSAPCNFAWVALGSQGRQEQSAKSDQDNALVLADTAAPGDREYFLELARFVNAGLDACGYVYCPGDVMARNPEWCQPLSVWRRTFHRWISTPEEKALMHANIFFDLRSVYGTAALVDDLKESIRRSASENTIFLALMAKNAMNFQPPLGFFRQFVLERSGEHRNTLDLKLHGIMPIVEIARIRSLAAGQMRIGTRNRLRAAAGAGEITETDAANLIDALDFIEEQRLVHQSRQLQAGRAPDNHLSPDDLSPLVRQNLKASFSQVRVSQAAMLSRFHIT